MTVVYSGNFFKALFRWRGSVWKTVWKELFVWLAFYYALRFLLHSPLLAPYSLTIAAVVKLFRDYTQRLPLEFLLGFYVTQVVGRWWAQVSALPWPDEVMSHACSVLFENSDEVRGRRRAVGRYIIASLVLAYRNVSTSVSKTFPTLMKLEQIGLLTSDERLILEKSGYVDLQYELPLQWIHEIVRTKTGSTQGSIVFALNSVRNNIRNLIHYNAISFPLVYTQTVTVAVYGYFIFCLIGHQFYDDKINTVIPFLTILRFIFGVGWLKVAEDLGKPFGSDDDDVELIYWLNRHVRLVFTVTDYALAKQPESCWTNDTSSLIKALNISRKDRQEEKSFGGVVKKILNKRKTFQTTKSVLPFTSENY